MIKFKDIKYKSRQTIFIAVTIIFNTIETLDFLIENMIEDYNYSSETIENYNMAYNYNDLYNKPQTPVNYSRVFTRFTTGGGSSRLRNNINPLWITGFTDAEGSFGISTKTINNSSLKVNLQFKITQKVTNYNLLNDLRDYFDCGNVVKDKGIAFKFQVQDLNSIITKVIPHFDNNPLVSSKAMDYNNWKEVANLLKDKRHIREEG
jgi:hypothetical protein